ncbi:MAG: low-specificity L-threonine aldolase [Myxococcota bacterium]
MREALLTCAVGDDVMREDPTVNELEGYAANLLGKDAALLVPSGTFSNQCALLSHTKSSDEVIVAEGCHIVQHEGGGAALISRAQLRVIAPENGKYLTAVEIEKRIRKRADIHYPETGLICLEQATAFGNVIPLSIMKEIRELANKRNIPVHIDGARIFNAAHVLGVEAKEIAAFCDSISVCLSKGLSAPVGSLLIGGEEFIERARKNRKIMGGGMRQAGFIASAGLIALRDMRERLKEDHANARLLARLLSEIEGVEITREPEINMVFVSLEKLGIRNDEVVTRFAENGIKIYPRESGEFRFVTHYGITEESVRKFVEVFKKVIERR